MGNRRWGRRPWQKQGQARPTYLTIPGSSVYHQTTSESNFGQFTAFIASADPTVQDIMDYTQYPEVSLKRILSKTQDVPLCFS